MLNPKLLQLVEQAQAGDDNAMESIIAQFNPLVEKVSREATPNEERDLQQYLHEKMIQAIYNYDISTLPDLDECLMYLSFDQIQQSAFQ